MFLSAGPPSDPTTGDSASSEDLRVPAVRPLGCSRGRAVPRRRWPPPARPQTLVVFLRQGERRSGAGADGFPLFPARARYRIIVPWEMRQVFPRTTTETQQVRHNESICACRVLVAAQNRVCLCSHHQTGRGSAAGSSCTIGQGAKKRLPLSGWHARQPLL